VARGTLTIDTRTVLLEAFTADPRLPISSFEFDGAPVSSQPATVRLKLTEPARVSYSVKLTLGGLDDDPAVALLPSGGRLATIVILPGATEATQLIQTGTTAGPLTLRLDVGSQTQSAIGIVLPSLTQLSAASAVRLASQVEIRMTGFDNTQKTDHLGFTFHAKDGSVIGGAPLVVDATKVFEPYYASSGIGGLFSLRATFPVAGDVQQIADVDIEVTNAAGSSPARRVVLQDQ
jgi:hypothetical protein